jgi:hypothetical protein
MNDSNDLLQDLFARACELPPDQREHFLAGLAGDELALLPQLLELLASDSEAGPLPIDGTPLLLRFDFGSDLRALSPPPSRYELRGELGRGGMGRVDLAWDVALQREVARKTMLTADFDLTGERKARFVREAHITSGLMHPGIPPVYDLGVDADGNVFFTMQRLQGRRLHEVFDLARRGDSGWSMHRALHVLVRVCETVAFAHARGVLHRDLKPSNVVVGEYGEVYVVDWGIARRQVTSSTKGGCDENRGDLLGTPQHMAPEQADGSVDVDVRADVYAVGLLLYELLTGRRPFATLAGPDGQAPSDLLRARIATGHRLDFAGCERLPRELVAICQRATHVAREQRYPGMNAMAADLRAHLEHRPGSVRIGLVATLRKWVRRNPLAAGLSSLLVVGAVGFVVFLVQAASRDRELRRQAEVASSRARGLHALALAQVPGREPEALAAAIQAAAEPLLAGAPVPDEAVAGLLASVECARYGLPLRGGDGSGAITAALTADGAWVAIGTIQGGVHLFSGVDRRLHRSWQVRRSIGRDDDPGKPNTIRSLAWAPDAGSLLVRTYGNVTLLDPRQDREIARWDDCRSAAFFDGGKSLAVGSGRGVVCFGLTDLRADHAAKPRVSWATNLPVNDLCSGGSVLAARDLGDTFWLLKLPDLTPIGEVRDADHPRAKWVLSACGGTFVVAEEARLRWFAPRDGLRLRHESSLARPTTDLAFSWNGQWLAVADGSRSVRLFEVDGDDHGDVEFDDDVENVVFSDGDAWLVVGCRDQVVRWHRVSVQPHQGTGRRLVVEQQADGASRAVKWPLVDVVAARQAAAFVSGRVGDTPFLCRIEADDHEQHAYAGQALVARDGARLVIRDLARTSVHDGAPDENSAPTSMYHGAFPDLLSPSGDALLVRRELGLWLYDLATARVRLERTAVAPEHPAPCFTADGSKLLCMDAPESDRVSDFSRPRFDGEPLPPSRRSLVVLDAATGVEIAIGTEIQWTSNRVRKIVPGPSQMVGLLMDDEVVVLTLPTLATVRRLPCPDVRDCSFASDGRHIGILGDSHLRIETFADGGAPAISPYLNGDLLASAPDGGFLATVDNGVARVDARGRLLVIYEEPWLLPAAFSPDGVLLALRGNHQVFVYRGLERDPVARFAHRDVDAVTFTADGSSLIGVGGGVWRRWDLDPRRLLARACTILQPEPEWQSFAGRYEGLRTGK